MKKSSTTFTLLLMLSTILCLLPGTAAGIQSDADDLAWLGMEEAQERAAAEDKKVMVYAEASWCTYCNKMEREVFTDKEVQQVVSTYFFPVKVDIESDHIISYNGREMTEREYAGSMRVAATPTFLFVDGEGNILGGQPGYIPPDVFKALLTYVGSDAFSRVKFDHFYENEYQKPEK